MQEGIAHHDDQIVIVDRHHFPIPETHPSFAAAVPAGSDRASLDDRSTDVRLALASLRRALAEHSTGRAGEWTVSPQGSWFRDPHGQRADLARHGALCRVLAALTLRRLAAPGSVVSVDRLFQCGWPGERALPQAAVQRVYTALWALRKLGLRDLIRRRDNGYLLDPEARLVQAAARLPPAGGRARGGPRARP